MFLINYFLDNFVRVFFLNSFRELIGCFFLNFIYINNIIVLIEVVSKMINWMILLFYFSF